jgi:hypothetical protein
VSVVFARYREGIVSEAQRISHVLTVPDDGSVPDTLESLCGLSFRPGVLEQLPPFAGMPCLVCTLNMPTGNAIEQ